MSTDVRILLVADSHLGFDYPLRPRVGRRRRGHDFFTNYTAALEPAFAGEADVVVHAGDVFDRPMVHATVGPADFMFTTASDVVRPREVPREFAVVVTGHIHRHQVLTVGRDGGALHTPVLYPGSIERTSLAEIDEPKGFMMVYVEESEG